MIHLLIYQRRRNLHRPATPGAVFLLAKQLWGIKQQYSCFSSRLCGEYPDIRLGLSREPPWDAEAAVLDQDDAELGLWSIGACHGYDAVPIALLNLDYLNGYGFGKSQRADELRPARDPGRPERECSAMEAWP